MGDHSDDLDQLLDKPESRLFGSKVWSGDAAVVARNRNSLVEYLQDEGLFNFPFFYVLFCDYLFCLSYRGPDCSSDGLGGNKQEYLNSTLATVKGLGMGLPDLNVKKKGKQKAPVPNQESHISEALDKLREQTREAVKGLESVTVPQPASGGDVMIEDWVKQFEELAGSQDMESMVETMMQQLLSKEILYEPMKEIAERYPTWLEENKSKLTNEEYERYSLQYDLIKDLNRVYETEPDNFTKVVELMQKMQECGQPPNDIVQELAPEFDLSNLGQLSPEMLESQQNCCIM